MQALRGLEKEKDMRFDVLIDAIEQALLSAYHKTPGSFRHARAKVDNSSGIVTIYAKEELSVDEDGIAQLSEEFDDTPDDFGRIATSTARQVIVQRLRQAGD